MRDDLPVLPPRPADGHKGTFGTVLVVGGQAATPRVMIGGPAFAAEGALRVGAGLAILAVPKPIIREALVVAPSATGLALPVERTGGLAASEIATILDDYVPACRCVAVGPGFGFDPSQQQIVLRLAGHADRPLVIDADGLNALAAAPDFARDLRGRVVLTPHPGEYRRLADALSIDSDPVDPRSRPDAAAALARRLGCVVVLKGPNTVISDGLETVINESGNVALATAGTGDVLTGMIAGLIAQYAATAPGADAGDAATLSLLDCARLAVHLHGAAADRWASRHGDAGLLASDLLAEIPDVLQACRGEAAKG
ncbi:MAG: NAD(P)H-hydrate dehydratase [Planctomycetota bacterium]|jgi:NAD(P)H-hydrate epimerase